MSQRAAFQLETYIFNDIKLFFEDQKPKDISVFFHPKGEFDSENKTFDLTLVFHAADNENNDNPFITVNCVGTFKFEGVNTIEEIPSFFYKNAIAILFPYIRGFVSSLTALANITPLILPTYNLGELEGPLRESTVTK